jgi:uncharacterized membrane protein
MHSVHPLHAALLGGALALFIGGLISDLAYSSSYQVQWSNFAAWLIAGGMVFVGLSLLWALIELFAARGGGALLYVILLLATFLTGLLDSFVHARDAWAVMPMGLFLSVVVTVLTLVAMGLRFITSRAGADR